MKNRAHVPTSSVYSTHVMNPRPKSPNAASPTSSYDSSGRLVASCGFRDGMTLVIVANTALMGLERHPMDPRQKVLLEHVNLVFTALYLAEALIKLLGLGVRPYLADGWNRFEALLVLANLATLALTAALAPPTAAATAAAGGAGGAAANISPFRALRVLRLGRSLRAVRMLTLTVYFACE